MTDATAPKPRSSWRTSAKRTFTETVEAQPTLNSATLAGLYAACDLIDAADTMQRTVDAEGVIATGSQGQPVAHPLIAEVRHYRREAVALLRALGLTAQSASQAAASALANKRWQDRAALGGNVTPITGVRKSARDRYRDADVPEQAAASGDPAPF
ncbi:P27 family phage terminase small subunit [Microbacterium sp. IEGM 1404]|uniref:P27 family phage terminase small subunit n=1 Tax=Microbacterium sp. IEGM 1404 TaxID=3047084 RepID=UPI0024B66F15|nr:P27 family phage terminase small subunit [Microbacterium sp. IEGM 1404]MDI9890567.1 P27 family phage terminase small subunit [Microbacterium sp. IEGM 1404]